MRRLHIIRTKTREHSSRTVQTIVTINIIRNKWRLLLLVLCALCPACFTCFCAAAHLIAINSSLSGRLRRWRSASGVLERRNIPDTQAGQVVLGRCVSLGANTATHRTPNHTWSTLTELRGDASLTETQVQAEREGFFYFLFSAAYSVSYFWCTNAPVLGIR